MSSRMSKYYEESLDTSSRYHKNEELYKEISKSELESFDIKSNATILGENKNEIDVEKIKKILDNKYNEIPKRRSIRLDETIDVEEEKEVTKEYDINVILEKAREQKKDNYEEERLRKLRDTQFDILNNLNISKKEDEEDRDLIEDNLKELINTIALNEKRHNDSSPLDILSDLKGSEDTEVLDGLKGEIDELEDKLEKEDKSITDTGMINSFYTSSNALKNKDFEDIDDFSKSIESNNVFIKIIIGIVIIVFLVGVAILIKTLYFS